MTKYFQCRFKDSKSHFVLHLFVFFMVLIQLLLMSIASANPARLLNLESKTEVTAQNKSDEEPVHVLTGPEDEYGRGVPRSTAKGFVAAIDSGDYERAVEYLDLRNLPKGMSKEDGIDLAKKLKVVLDRTLWVDMDTISNSAEGHANDGLPTYRDRVGQIKAGKKHINVLLQRVPRKDGVYIWKLSNRTVGQIPLLYEYHGYTQLEEYLANTFPDYQIFGWQLWQWASWAVLIGVSFLLVWIPTFFAGRFFMRQKSMLRNRIADYLTGPLRLSLWVISVHLIIDLLGPSEAVRKVFDAGTIMYVVLTWAVIRLVDLWSIWGAQILDNKQRHAALVLLKPIKTVFKVIIILTGLLLWLDNLGIHVGTLLASLGIGGFALALAAQDLLKNLLGSVVILMDRPYEIGQRIVVKGHDGVVEEIGLRSTKMRLLTGHQVSIPNEDMARADIENIGRRPHIRRKVNLAIPLDTPVEKVEQAIGIVKKCLENHKCMDPAYPPRVYFDEINRDSINISILVWYNSTDFWAFQAFNEELNLKILQDFEAAGIEFALPSFNAFPAHESPQNETAAVAIQKI